MLIAALIVLALVLIVVFVRYYVNAKDDFWPKQGVPLLSLNEIAGAYKRFTMQVCFTTLHRQIYDKLKGHKYGGYMEVRTPVFYPMDLDLLKLILVKDFDHFTERRVIDMRATDPVLTRMMTNLTGQEWKDLRSIMSPTFTTGKIKRMFRHFNACGSHMTEYLKEKAREAERNGSPNVVDFQDCFGRYTMDTIASISFGLETDVFKEDKSVFREMAKRFQSFTLWRMMKALIIISMPFVGRLFKIRFSEPVSMEFFTEIAHANIKQRREGDQGKRQDFLDLMLEAQSGKLKMDENDVTDLYEKDAMLSNGIGSKKESAVVLDDRTVVAQCLLFFSAGSDTMETALTFAIYALAVDQQVQEKLANEIEQVMDDNDGNLTYEAVNQMEYLDMVISETLRLYPPAFATERTCTKEYTIPGTNIHLPKGARVAIPITGIHHDERYYPNPDQFNPENFNAKNKAERHPYAYMPFGLGPRNCVAMRFALTEAKAAIVHLIHEFKVEPCEKTQIPVKFSKKSFIIKPEKGMFLTFTERR